MQHPLEQNQGKFPSLSLTSSMPKVSKNSDYQDCVRYTVHNLFANRDFAHFWLPLVSFTRDICVNILPTPNG